jgi:hypothetical protein
MIITNYWLGDALSCGYVAARRVAEISRVALLAGKQASSVTVLDCAAVNGAWIVVIAVHWGGLASYLWITGVGIARVIRGARNGNEAAACCLSSAIASVSSTGATIITLDRLSWARISGVIAHTGRARVGPRASYVSAWNTKLSNGNKRTLATSQARVGSAWVVIIADLLSNRASRYSITFSDVTQVVSNARDLRKIASSVAWEASILRAHVGVIANFAHMSATSGSRTRIYSASLSVITANWSKCAISSMRVTSVVCTQAVVIAHDGGMIAPGYRITSVDSTIVAIATRDWNILTSPVDAWVVGTHTVIIANHGSVHTASRFVASINGTRISIVTIDVCVRANSVGAGIIGTSRVIIAVDGGSGDTRSVLGCTHQGEALICDFRCAIYNISRSVTLSTVLYGRVLTLSSGAIAGTNHTTIASAAVNCFAVAAKARVTIIVGTSVSIVAGYVCVGAAC